MARGVRTRRSATTRRSADSASNTPTTTATPIFTPADSPVVTNTPPSSDNEVSKPNPQEKMQEVRVTRSKKRVFALTEEKNSKERATKRRTIANRAYVAVRARTPKEKVSLRVRYDRHPTDGSYQGVVPIPISDKAKGKARVTTPSSQPASGDEFQESSGTSGSEFVVSEEDNSEDEEIMVDAAVRLSLQTAISNGVGTSSGRQTGPSPAAVLRAEAAEQRLAHRKMLAQYDEDIDEEDEEDDDYASNSDPPSVTSPASSESEEEPLAKKGKKAVKVRSKAVLSSLEDLRKLRKQTLAQKRELKKEERALAAKLGRRLTPVLFLLPSAISVSDFVISRLRKRLLLCTDSTQSLRRLGVI